MAFGRGSTEFVYLQKKSNLQKMLKKMDVRLHMKMIWLNFHDAIPNTLREIEFL